MYVIARNADCQFTDSVAPVPMDIQTEKKIFYRVENRDTVGIQITDHVSIPKIEPFQTCVHGNTVTDTVVYRTETETKCVSFAILCCGSHGVVAELISSLHILFRPKFQLLFCG